MQKRTFHWDHDGKNVDGYRIYVSHTKGVHRIGAGHELADVTGRSATDFVFLPGTYYCVMTAYKGDLESEPSNEVRHVVHDPKINMYCVEKSKLIKEQERINKRLTKINNILND